MLFRFFMIMVMILGTPRPGWAADIIAKDGSLVLPRTGLPDEMMNLKGSWRFYPLRVMPLTDSCPDAGAEENRQHECLVQGPRGVAQSDAGLRRIGLMLPVEHACTMERSADTVKLPPTARQLAYGIKGYKRPSLMEAYQHFFGRPFEGAHDAMADVRACRDVFFALKQAESQTAGGQAA